MGRRWSTHASAARTTSSTPTHPQVQKFLDELFRGLRKDGFTYFKLDFLYGAAYEAGRHDPEVTGTQALRSGLKRIFDAVNPPGKPEQTFLLACGAPLMPVVGLVHGARTGGDVGIPQMEDGKATAPQLGFPLILSMGPQPGGPSLPRSIPVRGRRRASRWRRRRN